MTVIARGSESNIYKNAKRLPLKEVRALRAGDMLEAYYADTEKPETVLVVNDVQANETHDDVRVLHIQRLTGEHRSKRMSCFTFVDTLNTDKFKHVGSAMFENGSFRVLTK